MYRGRQWQAPSGAFLTWTPSSWGCHEMVSTWQPSFKNIEVGHLWAGWCSSLRCGGLAEKQSWRDAVASFQRNAHRKKVGESQCTRRKHLLTLVSHNCFLKACKKRKLHGEHPPLHIAVGWLSAMVYKSSLCCFLLQHLLKCFLWLQFFHLKGEGQILHPTGRRSASSSYPDSWRAPNRAREREISCIGCIGLLVQEIQPQKGFFCVCGQEYFYWIMGLLPSSFLALFLSSCLSLWVKLEWCWKAS